MWSGLNVAAHAVVETLSATCLANQWQPWQAEEPQCRVPERQGIGECGFCVAWTARAMNKSLDRSSSTRMNYWMPP